MERKLEGSNSYVYDVSEGEEDSFHASFLSKMKLKHFFVPLEIRVRLIVQGILFYAFYCASRFLWTSVIQFKPQLLREI